MAALAGLLPGAGLLDVGQVAGAAGAGMVLAGAGPGARAGCQRCPNCHAAHSQPPIISTPPIGVIAPSQRGAPSAMA